MREQKGITLIALVITIIVLLILAGVTIAMLSGENSILNRSTEAAYTNDIAEGKDQVSIAWNAAYTQYLAKYYTNTLGSDTFGSLLADELTAVNNNPNKYSLTFADPVVDGGKIRVTSGSNKNKYSEADVDIDIDAKAVTQASLGAWSAIN